MCGITGVLNLVERPPVEAAVMRGMLSMLRHRGPDEFGLYLDERVALGSARLSIIDLSSGQQPIANEDETLWIVFNGEIFNYVELRPGLEARGHRFSTHTDTEVVLHLYEELGPGCLAHLNGQFAIAIWDTRKHELFLARDRMGIRPLFYTMHDGRLIWASEIKSILAYPGLQAALDPVALDQILTFWSTLSPRTVFRNVQDIPPGHYALVRDAQPEIHPYWTLDFAPPAQPRAATELVEELADLLIDATRIRLRADVPVGAYLSGGLDSSTTTAIIRNYTHNRLDTFSIAFDDPEFDESGFQQRMAAFLGTDHLVVRCTHADIGRVFPDVIWHTETPILRTSPAPMFLLSKLVQDHGLKVVMTGEGADEILAGYDLFKEMQIRRFWARQPGSQLRPLLLRRLYPDISDLSSVSGAFLKAFFSRDLADTVSPFYSHAIRWSNTARIRRLLVCPVEKEDLQREGCAIGTNGHQVPPELPPALQGWTHLAQAQYLEISIFLSQYLLSSQGDRVAMAHSVEGRFPFLDYRVVEFCNSLPSNLKLRGLTEKWLLKQLGRKWLPPEIWQRPKRPYRAPIHRSFFGASTPEYVRDLLSERALRDSGLFNPTAVAHLARKASESARLSEADDMALVAILSTQLVYHQFVTNFPQPCPDGLSPIKVVDQISRRVA